VKRDEPSVLVRTWKAGAYACRFLREILLRMRIGGLGNVTLETESKRTGKTGGCGE
jgi:hypothetical protein